MKKMILLLLFCCTSLMAEDFSILPELIKISSGDVKIKLLKKTFWNLHSIHYKKNYAARTNGWYGTVFNYQGLGFIGSGHLENKIGEKIKALEFYIDGIKFSNKKIKESPIIECTKFKYKKISILLDVKLTYSCKLENSIITEKVKLDVIRDSAISTCYNFMHCWNPNFTDYLLAGNKTMAGTFTKADSNKNFIVYKPYIGALFNSNSNYGIVSVIKKNPTNAKSFWMLWSRIPGYRKLYLAGFRNQELAKGSSFSFEMATHFFESNSGNWKKTAKKIAKISTNNVKPASK